LVRANHPGEGLLGFACGPSSGHLGGRLAGHRQIRWFCNGRNEPCGRPRPARLRR
jgi:hypothetical protein